MTETRTAGGLFYFCGWGPDLAKAERDASIGHAARHNYMRYLRQRRYRSGFWMHISFCHLWERWGLRYNQKLGRPVKFCSPALYLRHLSVSICSRGLLAYMFYWSAQVARKQIREDNPNYLKLQVEDISNREGEVWNKRDTMVQLERSTMAIRTAQRSFVQVVRPFRDFLPSVAKSIIAAT